MNNTLIVDNYQSKYTKKKMCEIYPSIDISRLIYSLVACVFILGLPL